MAVFLVEVGHAYELGILVKTVSRCRRILGIPGGGRRYGIVLTGGFRNPLPVITLASTLP